MISLLFIMGINKFFDYLLSHKLVELCTDTKQNNSTLFIDGTNIFRFFSEIQKDGKNSFTNVKDLIIRFIPTDSIYISMDGICPEQKNINHTSKQIKTQTLIDDADLAIIEKKHEQSFIKFGRSINRDIHYYGREI